MALTTIERQTPTGFMLENGYQALLAFGADPDVDIWEKQVKAPGDDGGDLIDVTTQHNTEVRTFAPRGLRTVTNGQIVVAYDPKCRDSIRAMINVNQNISVHYPNGDVENFFGVIKTFDPTPLQEGEHPTATMDIGVTNRDPSTGAETVPNYITAAGTDS